MENELVFSLEQLDTNDRDTSGMKHDQADKLDCLMVAMFEYTTAVCVNQGKVMSTRSLTSEHRSFPGTVNYEQTKSLFRDFLSIFNRILLPTHDSSHVQFLLFHICSFHTVLFARGTFDQPLLSLGNRSVGLQRRIHEQLLEDIRLSVSIDGISSSVDLLPVEFNRASEIHHHSVGSTASNHDRHTRPSV